MKKIELNILSIIIFEAVYLLLFFKTNFINIILGFLLGITLILLTKNIKKNKITNLFLIVTITILFIISLIKTVNFISYNILKNHSTIIIYISILLLINYLSKKHHSFIKSIEIFFYIMIFIKLIIFILTIPLINIQNIVLALNIDYNFVLIGLSIFLLQKCIYYYSNYYISKTTIIISIFNPLIIKMMTILIIGSPLSNIYKYPYVNYLKDIKYLDFIERLDGILSFEYLFSFITLLSFMLLIIKNKRKNQ